MNYCIIYNNLSLIQFDSNFRYISKNMAYSFMVDGHV
jgi:hypothetical protein